MLHIQNKTDASLIHSADSWILNYHDAIKLRVISYNFRYNYIGAYTGLVLYLIIRESVYETRGVSVCSGSDVES